MVYKSLLGAVVLVTAAAAVTDARSGRIPNALTIPLAVLAPLAHWLHFGSGGLFSSLLGATVNAAMPFVLFVRGAMGGGDVKLFCGLGAALGPSLGLEVQLGAYALAGGHGICRLVRRGQLLATLKSAFAKSPTGSAESGIEGPGAIRLGVPIFLAAMLRVGPRILGG